MWYYNGIDSTYRVLRMAKGCCEKCLLKYYIFASTSKCNNLFLYTLYGKKDVILIRHLTNCFLCLGHKGFIYAF